MSHTPGPWRAQQEIETSALDPKRETFQRIYKEVGRFRCVATIQGGGDQERADASLIAAAPDLLSIVSSIVVGDELGILTRGGLIMPGLVDSAREALAKAQGAT